MGLRLKVGIGLLTLVTGAQTAGAEPLVYSLGTCTIGNCAAFNLSGGGSIEATLDVVNGNDLLITLENALNADALNDDPFLAKMGFQYGGLLSNLTMTSFTVLSGFVTPPSFLVEFSQGAFNIDFGFDFQDERNSPNPGGRFQAMDPNEIVQILVGTTGHLDLNLFGLGMAKVDGTGLNGRGDPAVLTGSPRSRVPEPGSMLLMSVGAAGLVVRRRRRLQAGV